MYSLNAPVPAAVDRLVDDHADRLAAFETIRDVYTLVIKRFGPRAPAAVDALARDLETVLAEWGPIEARITGFDAFSDPPGGPAPVLYLAVESPGLVALHEALIRTFGTVSSEIEGERYVPHITLARGGARTAIAPLTDREIDPIMWTIDEVTLWDARYDQPVSTFSLPSGRRYVSDG